MNEGGSGCAGRRSVDAKGRRYSANRRPGSSSRSTWWVMPDATSDRRRVARRTSARNAALLIDMSGPATTIVSRMRTYHAASRRNHAQQKT
jgi:hypothetical protein